MTSEQIVGSGLLAAILVLYFMIWVLNRRVNLVIESLEVQLKIEDYRESKWGSSWPVNPETKEKS